VIAADAVVAPVPPYAIPIVLAFQIPVVNAPTPVRLEFTTVLPTEPFLYFDETGLSFIKNSQNLNKNIQIDFLKGKLGWRLRRSQHESNLKKVRA